MNLRFCKISVLGLLIFCACSSVPEKPTPFVVEPPKAANDDTQAMNFANILSQIEGSGELPDGVEVYYLNGLKIVKTDPHPIDKNRCYYKHVYDGANHYKFTSMSCFPPANGRLSGDPL